MTTQPQYFLTTARIGFRTWDLDHLDAAMELWNDEDVSAYIGGTPTIGAAHRRILREQMTLRLYNVQYWPIFHLHTGDFIGSCGLQPYGKDKKTYGIAVLINKKFRQQGFATEAAQAMIGYAFNTLNAESLCAEHHQCPAPPTRLLEKLGFLYTHDEYYAPLDIHKPTYMLRRPIQKKDRSSPGPPKDTRL